MKLYRITWVSRFAKSLITSKPAEKMNKNLKIVAIKAQLFKITSESPKRVVAILLVV